MDSFASLDQSRVALLDLPVIRQLLNSDHGANAEISAGSADALQLLDTPQANDLIRRMDLLFHQAHQIGAARQDLGPTPGEVIERILEGRG
jgi:hypothetical protein